MKENKQKDMIKVSEKSEELRSLLLLAAFGTMIYTLYLIWFILK